MLTEVVIPLLSALFGGVVVTFLNYLFNKRKSEAEIDKIKAETDKVHAETEKIELSVESVKTGQQKQANTIKDIQRFLVRHLLTEDERGHLERLATRKYWSFQKDGTTKFFLNELRNLRSMNLIEGQPNKGIRSLLKESGDINAHFKIRPEGEEYLQLLSMSNEGE